MKSNLLVMLVLTYLINTNVSAQNTLFLSSYGSPNGGEEMEGIIQTSDGNLLTVGMSDSYSSGDADALVIKTDIDGNIIWSNTYGGSGDDMSLDVKETVDGGFVMCGWTQSFGAGGYDMWVIKIDANGNMLWQYSYGGSNDEQAWSIEITGSGFLVVGGTNSFGAGLTDVLVLNLDASGNILWQKAFGSIGDDAPAGPYEEYVAKGIEDADGNYLISSLTDGMGNGATDIWLAKINPTTGNIIWQYAYGDVDEESTWSFIESPLGGYYLPGNTVDPNSFEGDLWIVSLDTAGNILWQNKYGLNGTWDEALNATTNTDGSLIISSYFEQSSNDWAASTIKVDALGALLWAKKIKLGALDWTNVAAPLSDNTIIYAGVTTLDTINYDEDLLFMRTDSNGNIGSCNQLTDLVISPSATNTTKLATNATITNTSIIPQTTNAVKNTVTLTVNNYCTENILSTNDIIAENELINIFPNPANGEIQIQSFYMENAEVKIYNSTGALLNSFTIQGQEKVKYSLIENGFYYIQVTTSKGDRITKRLININ